MEVENAESSALLDYLKKLGLGGHYWLAGGSEKLAPILKEQFPSIPINQGIPDTAETLEECSVLLLGPHEQDLREILRTRLPATGNLPTIILFGDLTLSESDRNRLQAIGYKLPPIQSEDASFQVVEHAELDHKGHF